MSQRTTTPRVIAFYLPQFHPIPENNDWWGAGFTEWTNVAKARPQFAGHYQPHLPADLGFYDLRLAEARRAQADLARMYGIHGFCYYHYWFNGRRLLERPFEEVVSSGEPDLPFCLCWANENWTRRWDGQNDEVLVRQSYGEEAEDRRHGQYLASVFRDPRYIRVDGRPLFLVYAASLLMDSARTAAIWRDEARRAGVADPFLCNVQVHDQADPRAIGFDAAVQFHPGPEPMGIPARRAGHAVYSYPSVARRMHRASQPLYRRFPCVLPAWDNSPRRASGATILHGSTPDLYQQWLEGALTASSDGDRVVFVNAWNEWAEGAHLEPCQRWGRAYLEATRVALERARVGATTPPPDSGVGCSEDSGTGTTATDIEEQRAAAHTAIEDLDVANAKSLTAARSELDALRAELAHLDRLAVVVATVAAAVPDGVRFLLVDDEQLALGGAVAGRAAVPFTERSRKYWGPPPDDDAAVRELERQLAVGVRHVAVTWPCRWYLDHYPGWARRLRTAYRAVAESDEIILFVHP